MQVCGARAQAIMDDYSCSLNFLNGGAEAGA